MDHPQRWTNKNSHRTRFFSDRCVSSDVCVVFAMSVCVCAGHQEKPNVLTFHPQARDLLMSAGYDGKIFLWDLSTHRVAMEMETLSQPVGSCFMYCTFPIMFLFIISFLLLPGVQMECALLHSLRITVYESTILGALPVPLKRGRDLWEAEGQGSHG